MGSSRLLSFFFYGILIHLAKPTIAQRDPYVLHQCSTNNSTSAYRANLNSLLSYLIYLTTKPIMGSTISLPERTPTKLIALTSTTVSDVSGTFKKMRGTLLDSLRSKAASCTPDLEEQECSNCLNKTIRYVPNCCDDMAGVRVLTPSCNLRYENKRFYDTTPDVLPPSSSPPPPPAEGKLGSNSSRTTIIVVATVVFVVLIICICVCIYLIVKKRRKKVETVDEIISAESLQFDFATIRVATENFSDANRLGQGGFGAVYKGMLSNGQEIAVKRLSTGSGQGDQEFKNEVFLLAKLQHRNLVRLLGLCLEGNERILIYELMPNASLDHFIFDPVKRLHLDWESVTKS
ncbi:hypothetical protein SLA2020_367360 [Shorea laevis]